VPEPDELPDDMKWIDDLPTINPAERLKAVSDYVSGLLASPEGTQLLLKTVGSTTMPQGVAKEMAREIILQLTPSSVQQLAQEGYFQKQSSYEILSLLIVRSFAGVLLVSCLALTITPFFQNINSTATQMLLTVFTTSVGFLSGFFAPSPGSQPAPPILTRSIDREQSQSDQKRQMSDGSRIQ